MKKTILVIATIIGAGLYFEKDPKVIETVREVETVQEMTPILVKPNVIHVTYNTTIEYPGPVIDSPIEIPSTDLVDEMLNGVKFFEGFRPNAYYCCAGGKTIGYGETDKNIVALGAITEHKAAALLKKKLNSIREQVRKEVKVSLNDAQECALTSFTFNVGLSNLKQLINGDNRLNEGNYESVNKIMPLYCRAGGKVRKGLVKRRAWEVSLFNSKPAILR